MSLSLSKKQLAVISLIIANIIWGAAPPIFKWSLDQIQPFTLAFLRFALAAAILYPFVLKKMRIKNYDWPILLFISIIGMTCQIAYFNTGLGLTSSINLPIIISTAPILIIIGSKIFLHEKPEKKAIRGTILSLIGALIIILHPLFEKGLDNSLIGNILFVIATILFVFYTLLLKEISPKYNPLTLSFWIFILSAISFLPLMLLEAINTNQLLILDTKSIIGIFFGAIICTIVAYILQTFAIKHITAHEVGLFSYVDPVITILIARPLLGETVTSTFFLGSVLIFFGIFIAEGRLHYHPIHLLLKEKNQQVSTLPTPT
jgi:drug/metabolite transporter (DMT)-like permease